MDINVNNAFPIALKLTWGPCYKAFDVIMVIILKRSCDVIKYLLERPLLTTLLIVTIFWMLITTLSISVIIVAGVLCSVFTIIILQSLAAVIIAIFLILIISMALIGVVFLFAVMGIIIKTLK